MAPDETSTHRARLGMGRNELLLPRLAIGLAQGLMLYVLYWTMDHTPRLWPASVPEIHGPLVLVALYLPVVVLGGLGRLRAHSFAIWTVVCGLALALLGWHDMARQALEDVREPFLSLPLFPFLAAALFIAHHLILPADREGRPIAAYPGYFDTAWKAGVQLALSVAFTGALWLLLHLGASLFRVIGIDLLESLLGKPWVALPVSSITFALAVHLTDVREGLIRGVRAVALMLLSWLLPVIVALTAAFLAALPFTGLSNLWAYGSATALMLAAGAALIVLINSAYQDGTDDTRPPAALRWAAIIGSLLLIPLMIVASLGLGLRIGQHGLTPDRIVAAACILVGLAYGAGYGWAAVRSLRGDDWMRPLERTNIGVAALSVSLIVLLFSPVLDPARLSVMDQVARLERGAVSAEDFDYAFLRFESGKAGRAALERLTQSQDAEIAKWAHEAKASDYRMPYRLQSPHVEPPVRVEPASASDHLPEDFKAQIPDLSEVLRACRQSPCPARVVDMDGDGTAEVLIAQDNGVSVFQRLEDGRWIEDAVYEGTYCDEGGFDMVEAWKAGEYQTLPAQYPDMVLGGVRLRAQGNTAVCPTKAPSASPHR